MPQPVMPQHAAAAPCGAGGPPLPPPPPPAAPTAALLAATAGRTIAPLGNMAELQKPTDQEMKAPTDDKVAAMEGGAKPEEDGGCNCCT